MLLFFRLIFYILLLSMSWQLRAQPHEIFGKVIDTETKELIPFANIAIKDLYKGTASNILGEFSFKVDTLPIDLVISHLSYESLEITVSKSEEMVIEMIPGKLLMNEVVVTGAGNASFAYDLVRKAYYKVMGKGSEERYGKAFYRQISRNGDEYSELYEMFYDTKYSNNGVEDWAIQEGRYALKLSTVDSFIYNKNFTLMVRLLTIVQPKTDDLIMPVSELVSEQFDLRTERIISVNDRKVAIITFRKKEGIQYPALEGELSIDIDTYEVLKMKGVIADDNLNFISLKGKSGSWKNYVVSVELAFKPLDNGKLALDYMHLQQNFDYYFDDVFTSKVETKSFFTYYEYYDPPKKKQLGGRLMRFNQRDSEVLDAIGYNQLFWDENIIVKRTPVEAEVIESFERNRAFGSIYLNNKDQLILEDYLIDSDPFIVEVKSQLKKYLLPGNGEKVYIHHDRPMYAAGEDLWFRAYILNMATNSRSSGSGALHIDLLAPDGKPIVSEIHRMKDGESNGQIFIPKGVAAGVYTLVAYTDWMLNFDSKYFFRKQLKILNSADQTGNITWPVKHATSTFRYFPEGGFLLENIPGQIGFVAENELGEVIEVKGRLLDDSGRQLANIKSEFFGFGSLFLMPKTDINYRTVIMSGEFEVDTIPETKKEGYAMMVNNLKPNTVEITVRGTPRFEGKKFYLLVISNGVLFDRRIGIITKGLYRTEIPEAILPGGIAQILLVDDAGKITNKRLVFINQPHDANLKYYLPKREFRPRERVDLVLEVNDENGKALGFSNISVSVLDKDKISRDGSHQNIRSYLNLDYILDYQLEESGALFNDFDRETLKRFDWIMLNQKTVLPEIQSFDMDETKFDNAYERGDNLLIRGSAKANNGAPFASGFISFIAYPNPAIGSWYVRTDETGAFTLPDFTLPDSTRVSVMAWDAEGQPASVDISFSEQINYFEVGERKTVPFAMDNITKKYHSTLKNGSVQYADEETNREHPEERPNTLYDRPLGKQDNRIILDDKYHQYANMYQLLKGKISGLTSEDDDNDFQLKLKGKKDGAMIILDGLILNPEIIPHFPGTESTPLSDRLKAMEVADIDRIELIDQNEFNPYGVHWENGVVAIYSKEGSLQNFESSLLNEVWLPGFEEEAVFSSPNYAEDSKDGYDARATLYWNPRITTNRKGRVKISFYNSDEAKNMQICVEGMTAEGIPIFDLFDFGRNYSKTPRSGL